MNDRRGLSASVTAGALIAMGRDLSLDFANTVEWHAGPHPEERLTSYDKAVEWAERAGVLTDTQAQSLLARGKADPAEQEEALGRIVALREAIYRVFSAVAHNRSPDIADIELLNAELSLAMGHLRLVPADHSGASSAERAGVEVAQVAPDFDWSWAGVEDDLTSVIWPVARAATGLLTSPELAKVRECADDACGWLFLDHSRNGSRRWCDMADCGNRAKARRYRERRKEEAEGA